MMKSYKMYTPWLSKFDELSIPIKNSFVLVNPIMEGLMYFANTCSPSILGRTLCLNAQKSLG